MVGSRGGFWLTQISRISLNCIDDVKSHRTVWWESEGDFFVWGLCVDFLVFDFLFFMTENELTYRIIHCAMEVYNHLGPGLLEEVYERALMYELVNAGLKAESQVALPLVYKGVDLEKSYRVDILVEEKIILELKSVAQLEPVHYKQLLSYLKLSGLRIGYLINFNEKDFKNGYHRIVNGY